MSDIDLSKLGPAAKERPDPTLKGAVAAAAGTLAVAGFTAIAIDGYLPDRSKPVAIICGLVAVAVGYGIVIKVDRPVRPAGVAMLTLGTLLTVVAIFDDVSALTLPLLILGIAWGGQYVMGPVRGELPLLVGALISLWLLLLDAAGSDSSTGGDAEAFFVAPDTPVTSGDDLVTYLSLVLGLMLLMVARTLDKDGWHGAATGAVIVGDLAFVVGVFGVTGTLDSDAIGSVIIIVAGVVLAWIGAAGDRRFTAWLGGAGVLIGLIALLTSMIDNEEAVQFGVAAIAVAAALVAAIVLLEPDRRVERQKRKEDFWDGIAVDTVEQGSDPFATSYPADTDIKLESAPTAIPPEWHPDPHGRHELRWWDGSVWTDNVSDAGIASTDPEGA